MERFERRMEGDKTWQKKSKLTVSAQTEEMLTVAKVFSVAI